MKQYTEEELKRYIESAREIVKQEGKCRLISCSDCPFNDDGYCCDIPAEWITHVAAVGFLSIYDKENEQEGTNDVG